VGASCSFKTTNKIARRPRLDGHAGLPETRQLVSQLIDEVSAVAAASGYALPEATVRAREVLRTWSSEGKASMARDFERGNRTELEALTAALVRLGDAHGVDVAVARVAYALLKLRQQLESATDKGVGTAPVGR
jgi:2-dehydropantoate 2-reductase